MYCVVDGSSDGRAIDYNHRNRIERRIRDAGRRVREPRTEVRQQDAGLAGCARVSVRGVRRELFVARADESDPALAERIQKRDVRVAAEAEHDVDAEPLEVLREQVGCDSGFGAADGAIAGGSRRYSAHISPG